MLNRVVVKNFRSIVREEFDLSRLTLFVGKNDSGKSNFLRALNLFFNDQTDPGQRVDFRTDFSSHAKVGRGKARQIEVWLDISPPVSFSDQSRVRWRRAWRDGGATFAWQDFTHLGTGKPLEGRSKVLPWLARMRYRYVPAIKGQEYFSSLLRDVHDILAETVDRDLRDASGSFIDAIRGHTSQISSLTATALGIESRLQLPTNLRSLFEVLDFETTYGSSGRSLKQRGDGIKVRHISAVLKFLADQEQKAVGSGRSKPETIWGYEEPENNLEFSQAFQQAEELLGYSNEIQILLSTHSPAFYSLYGRDGVTGFSVVRGEEGTSLSRLDAVGVGAVNESLGLMQLVAPFVRDKVLDLERLNEQVLSLAQQVAKAKILVVLVAGQTDAAYIATTLDQSIKDRTSKVRVSYVGAAGSGGATGGGDQNLIRFDRELENQGISENKVLVLLDCDVASVPKDSSRVFYRKIPFNESNSKFKKGIENLLPESVALPEFYEELEREDGYGGVTRTTRLRKQALCDAYCSEQSDLPIPFAERMAAFDPVVDIIKSMIEN